MPLKVKGLVNTQQISEIAAFQARSRVEKNMWVLGSNYPKFELFVCIYNEDNLGQLLSLLESQFSYLQMRIMLIALSYKDERR